MTCKCSCHVTRGSMIHDEQGCLCNQKKEAGRKGISSEIEFIVNNHRFDGDTSDLISDLNRVVRRELRTARSEGFLYCLRQSSRLFVEELERLNAKEE